MDLVELEQVAAEDAAALGLLRQIRDESRELELKRFALAALWVEHHPYLVAAREEYEGDDLSGAPTIAVERAGRIEAARTAAEQVDGKAAEQVDGKAAEQVDGEAGASAAGSVDGDAPSVPRGLWRVEEFSIATVAAALGMGTDAAERLLLHADQLRTYLPQVFSLVLAGQFKLWRAREAAAATLWLTPEACAFVDDQLAWAPRDYGRRQLDGLIKQALIRHMPRQLAALQAALTDPGTRRVHIAHPDRAGGDAVIDARLGSADGRILDDVLTHLATRMREQGITLPAGELRALALGDLARAAYGQLPLPPDPDPTEQGATEQGAAARSADEQEPAPERVSLDAGGGQSADATGAEQIDDATDDLLGRTDGRGVPRGRILMYLHIDAADLWPGGLDSGSVPSTREQLERVPVRVEGGGIPPGTIVTADQLAPMFYRPSSLTDLTALARTQAPVPHSTRAPGTRPEGTGMPTPPPGTAEDDAPIPSTSGDGTPVPSRPSSTEGTGMPAGAADRHSGRYEGPQILVRPVIDLDQPRAVDTYTPTERIREQLLLADQQCSFPFCTASARTGDLDHIHPWHTDPAAPGGSSDAPAGGATCTCQLAPLCRYHHRVKTHARTGTPAPLGDTEDGFTRAGTGSGVGGGLHPAWDYVKLGHGTYLWHGPKGMRLLRTPHGSLEIETLHPDTDTKPATGPTGGEGAAPTAHPRPAGAPSPTSGPRAVPDRLLPPEWERALDAEWAKGTLAQALIAASEDTTITDRAELRRRAHATTLAEHAAAFPDEPPF